MTNRGYVIFSDMTAANSLPAPKTFFVEPDPHIISEDFLEKAFWLGYECYSIPRHFVRNLPDKIPTLLDLYPSLLMFLTLDHDDPPEGWREFYRKIQSHADFSRRVGILISPFVSPATAKKVRDVSLFEVGMGAGCVEMLASPSKSRDRLLKVLEYSEAHGRRKVIRWIGRKSDVVTFQTAAGARSVPLRDVSVSHFSVLVSELPPEWKVGTRLEGLSLRFAGAMLIASAVVAMLRSLSEGTLVVFVFHEDSDPVRAHQRRSKLNACIFAQYQKSTMAHLLEHLCSKQPGACTDE